MVNRLNKMCQGRDDKVSMNTVFFSGTELLDTTLFCCMEGTFRGGNKIAR